MAIEAENTESHQTHRGNPDRTWFKVISALLAATGVFHLFTAKDEKTPLYYFVAAGVLILFERVKNFKFGDLSFEVKQEIAEMASAKVESRLPGNIGGPKSGPPPEAATELPPRLLENIAEAEGPKVIDAALDDPNAGKFGRKAEANGRILEAVINPTGTVSGFVNLQLSVRSTDPSKPLHSKVVFHLHPTFTPPQRMIPPVDGVAKLHLLSYGAFTVGAQTDFAENQPLTSLELDLSKVPGGTKEFYVR